MRLNGCIPDDKVWLCTRTFCAPQIPLRTTKIFLMQVLYSAPPKYYFVPPSSSYFSPLLVLVFLLCNFDGCPAFVASVLALHFYIVVLPYMFKGSILPCGLFALILSFSCLLCIFFAPAFLRFNLALHLFLRLHFLHLAETPCHGWRRRWIASSGGCWSFYCCRRMVAHSCAAGWANGNSHCSNGVDASA